MKYKILRDDYIVFGTEKFYRIQAVKSFGNNVKKSDLGGYIQKEENLSQDGNCWVYGNAQVYGDAHVWENARVYDNARVYGDAQVYGEAQVYGNAYIKYCTCNFDIFKKENLEKYIACSLNVYPYRGSYILYKKVKKNKFIGSYQSNFEPSFMYRIGEISEVKDYDRNKNISCGKGLHVSTINYWDNGDSLIQVRVRVKDIICCLEGKLRVKKLKTLREVPLI